MNRKKSKKSLANMSFAVAADIIKSYSLELKKKGIRYKRVAARVGECEVPICIFSAKSEAEFTDLSIEIFSIIRTPLSPITYFVGDTETAFLTGLPGKVEINWDGYNLEKEENTALKDVCAQAAVCYQGILKKFSSIIGGWDIQLDIGAYNFIREPFAETSRSLHIFLNCVPPGEFFSCHKRRMFGLLLAADGKEQSCMKPAPSRGRVVKDDEGAVAQIVGANFYFLAPMIDCFNETTSAAIFELLLARCWDAYCEEKKENKKSNPSPPLKQEAFMTAACEWVTMLPQHLEKILSNSHIKLLGKFQEVAALQKEIRQNTQLLEVLKSDQYINNARNRLNEEWEKITTLPDIEHLAIIDDGLQAYTKLIIVKYNGAMFNTGSFVIRVSNFGVVAVWSENPTHPDRVPHPHINKNGTPCFGNATEAIIRAAAAFRYADTIIYVLRWLRDGYTPELALVKIEEWPQIKEEGAR